jgi:hypothetical protein
MHIAAHNGIVEVAQSAEERGQQQARREERHMMTCSSSLARAIAGRFQGSRPAAGPVITGHWPLATLELSALPYGRRLAVASSRCISTRPDIWQPQRHLSHSSTPHLEEAQKQLPVVVGQGPFLVFSASPFAVSLYLPFRLVCAGRCCCCCCCCPRLPRFPCRLPRTRQAAVHPTLPLHA